MAVMASKDLSAIPPRQIGHLTINRERRLSSFWAKVTETLDKFDGFGKSHA